MSTVDRLEEIELKMKEKRQSYKEIEEKQIKYLRNLMDENRKALEWFINNRYVYTHPIVTGTSTKGPILHRTNDYIYVWALDEGVIRFSTYNKEKESSNLRTVLEEGGFINAIQGLLFSEQALTNYLIELEDEILQRNQQLSAVENY